MITQSIKYHLLVCCFLINFVSADEHKIVFLISPPRSLSTAFLRMMEARKDFTIMHEPFELAYSLLHYPADRTQEWFYHDAPTTFEQVKDTILQQAQTSNVFVKDMSFGTKDFLLADQELMRNKNVYFVFLVRNPHHAIISFYKKRLNVSDRFEYLTGYQSLYEIFNHVKTCAVNPPLIVLSQDLYQDTPHAVERFCKHVDIAYKPDALNWQNLGDNFTGKNEWNELLTKDLAQHWHGDAMASSGFTTPRTYKTDEQGPTFEEIANLEHRKICRKIYDTSLVYYNLLLQEVTE